MGWPYADAHSVQREYWACVPGSLPGRSLFPSVKRRLLGWKCLGHRLSCPALDMDKSIWTFSPPVSVSSLVHCPRAGDIDAGSLAGPVSPGWAVWVELTLERKDKQPPCLPAADLGEVLFAYDLHEYVCRFHKTVAPGI